MAESTREVKNKKTFVPLSNLERLTYFATWILAVVYMFYHVYLEGKSTKQFVVVSCVSIKKVSCFFFLENPFIHHIVEKGWRFLQLNKDSDSYTNALSSSIFYLSLLILLHYCVVEYVKRNNPKVSKVRKKKTL